MLVTWGAGRPAFNPSNLPNLAAWFRYGQSITESAGAVSQWDDQSVNGRHLKQATATNQPALQADSSILFDGVDNFLKCDAFTLTQPETVYLLMRQVTWTANDYIVDGNTANVMVVRQANAGVTPQLSIAAGLVTAVNGDLALDTFGVVSAVFNGASSLLQVNNGTAATGNAGANNAGGLTLGRPADVASNYANFAVKEVVVYAAAHDAATRARVIAYLAAVGGLTL